MNITVKFMGSLGQELFGSDRLETTTLNLPEGSSVGRLFEHYNIPQSKEYVAIIDGRISQLDKILSDGVIVTFFHSAYGG